jgi:hypothetical protein
MLRIVLGSIGGFISWLIAWAVSEKLISAIWPAFGRHQAAFQAAITDGGEFTAETPMLLTHIVLGSIASLMAGYLAAVIAGDNSRAPMFAGILLLIMGIAKAAMTWQFVPIWYHVVFTATLLPMAVVGGKLITS